jgi:SAP domain
MADMTEFKKMKVQELRDELESRGLDTSGTKPVLLERLEEALNKTVATPTDAAPAVTAPPVTAPPVAVKETAPPATESQPPVAAAPVRRATLHRALLSNWELPLTPGPST